MQPDTRVFTTSHHRSSFGYDSLCGIDTRLSVTITQSFRYTGWDVEFEGRRFELWSPNSNYRPMYPGTRPVSFSMTPPQSIPRVDGSGGRYDWTLLPQHIDSNVFHHPFIIKPESAPHEPEFQYLTAVWKSANSTLGNLAPDYISRSLNRAAALENERLAQWDAIPAQWGYLRHLVDIHPTLNDITRLSGLIDWETCVHQYTHIQRLLREKSAWLLMLSALRHTNWELKPPNSGSIKQARSDLMGVWINGGSESHIRWLLHLGVPCYVIHEYREGVDFGASVPERRSRHCSQTFHFPEPWHLRPNINAYDVVAQRNPKTPWADPYASLEIGPNIKGSPDMLARSASHMHGYQRPVPDLYEPREPTEGSIVWQCELIYPSHVPWYKPPPIAPAWFKKWTRFAEETWDQPGSKWDGVTVMRKKGMKYTGDEDLHGPYYDRHLGRQLYFRTLDPVQGVVNATTYGRPAPYYNFVDMPTGRDGSPRFVERSQWFYFSDKPHSPEVM
jgi:hypothetical protein